MTEAERAEPLSVPAPGEVLAQAREARGWSHREMAMRLKFSPRQIEALEAGAYDALPGATIVRGMVRSYAKALGLDPQPLVAELDKRLHADPLTIVATPPMHVPLRESPKKSTWLYVGLSVLLVFAVAGLTIQWWFERQQPLAPVPAETTRSSAPVQTAPAPAPIEPEPELEPAPIMVSEPPPAAAVIPPVQAVAVPGRKRLEFVFDGESWVEVKDAAGRLLMAQLYPAASEAAVEGQPPFSLVIGNAASVRLFYEGSLVDLQSATRQDVARLTLE